MPPFVYHLSSPYVRCSSTGRKTGFTLIEISIVLVIVGLIVGGILVGRTLIRSAELQKQVQQLEKYTAAVNTFRLKYNEIPGDMKYSKAGEFGFFQMPGGDPAWWHAQNGTGYVYPGPNLFVGGVAEVLIFWRHLSEANLVDGSYGIAGDNAITSWGNPTGAVSAGELSGSFPLSPINGLYVVACEMGSTGFASPSNYDASWFAAQEPNLPHGNYFNLIPINGLTTGGVLSYVEGGGLASGDAYAIDAKADDGLPNTGKILARINTGGGDVNFHRNPSAAAVATSGICTIGSGSGNAADVYNRNNDGSPACTLVIRFTN